MKNSCQIRHNAYVRIILSDCVRFWCIFCMVSFRRRLRIAGGRFWCAARTQLIGHAARLLCFFKIDYRHISCILNALRLCQSALYMHKITRILVHNYQLSSYMLDYRLRDSPFTALEEIPFSYPRVGLHYAAKKSHRRLWIV